MSMDRFQLRYCVTQLKKFHSRQQRPIKVVVGNRNTVELNKMLFDGSSPLAVRRELKEVWAAMPPITKTRLYVTPTRSDELSTAMQALAKMSQRQIEQAIGNNDESLARTRRLLGEAKVDASVSEIVDRVESSDSGILVLAWHRSVIDALVAALEDKGVTVSKIDGGTPAHQKQSAQVDFNSGNIQVLVGQIAAMGTAIDLQHGGHNIIVVEEDWSPAVMDQAYARLHRMGQSNHVSAEILSTDTKLDKALSRIASNKSREHSNLLEQNND
jgi:SNF2 family DNA or RNA helicase